jgi:CubicO group peptidase (beta-lactamase class C family)
LFKLFHQMKSFILVFISFFCFKFSANGQLRKELEKIISFDADISYDLTPGFIIGIIDGDSVFFESFGHHAGKKDEKILPNDIFEIGSITKSITSSLLFQLQSKNILQIKDKVNKYLPVEYQNPRLKNLTIGDLMNCNSPFPKRPSGIGMFESEMQNPYSNYEKKDLLNYYRNFVPEEKSGFNYSHTNFGLLEIVIENASKKNFNDLMEQEIFEEQGMANSFVDFTERRLNVISPGQDRSLSAVEPWAFKSFAASEGIRSSAYDLASYIKFILRKAKLKNDSWKLVSDFSIPTFNDRLAYSFGWHNMKINKKTKAYISTGNTSGHSSFIGLIPETNTGVVLLSNSPYGTKDLGLLVLRMINYNWKRKA